MPRSGATILPAVSELAARQGLKLKELHLESGRLDEVFRTITVQPLTSDASLREAAWIDGNRARVRARSNGSLAYVYIPDFQERGIAAVLRHGSYPLQNLRRVVLAHAV